MPMPKSLGNGIPTSATAGLRLRIAISCLLGFHFLGVILAPIAIPWGGQPVPELARALYEPTTPWLNAVLLNQPWRFFAPEPGPISLQLFRIEYEDGGSTWLEYPRANQYVLRAPALQRSLAMAMRLEREIRPSSVSPQALDLTSSGVILAGACARHLARCASEDRRAIRFIQIWVLHHYPQTWEHAQNGGGQDDLRLWSACEIGAFAPDGAMIDTNKPPRAVPIPELAALWIMDRRSDFQAGQEDPSIFHCDSIWKQLERSSPSSPEEIAVRLSEELRGNEPRTSTEQQAGGSDR